MLVNKGSVTGNAVYVTAYDQSAYNPGCTPTPTCTPSTANPGWVFGFIIGSNGALTASLNSPYEAGVKPTAIASDPTDRFVYVTDYASNELIGYTILDGSTLSFLPNGPFKTGNEPSAVAIDPRGKFIYVTNALDSSVSPYAIDLATGTPTGAVSPAGAGNNATDTQPAAVMIDPALGRFVYTANYLGNSVSGFKLDPNTGELTANQAFTATATPAAGWGFSSWSGACSGTGTCMFTLTHEAWLNATFTQMSMPFSIRVVGPGTVTTGGSATLVARTVSTFSKVDPSRSVARRRML